MVLYGRSDGKRDAFRNSTFGLEDPKCDAPKFYHSDDIKIAFTALLDTNSRGNPNTSIVANVHPERVFTSVPNTLLYVWKQEKGI
jgi:hypothetical protein